MSDLTLSGQQLVVDMVNAANPSTLTDVPMVSTDVTYGVPAVLTDDPSGHNSSLLLTAAAGSSLYEGSVTVTYNRLDIGDVFAILAPQSVVVVPVDDVSDYASASDIVTYLNSTYSVAIVAADYVQEATGLSVLPGTYTLTAAESSLVYIGSVVINFQSTKKQLSSIVTNTSLGGLTDPASPS